MTDRNEQPDDPTRGFLDQTVPREDYWDGREPEEGPARPRHVQHPVAPQPLPDPRERRRNAIRGAAWTFGPSVGYLAATAAFSGDSAQADPRPAPAPEPAADSAPDDGGMDDGGMDGGMDYGGDYGGEIGSGL
ncbi:MAG TPA: hypothetical protein VGP26_13495 [Actinophytocola sp.]|jgi:hypothetical protein|nr:hypothetical protein [Actinophytocola sp.]